MDIQGLSFQTLILGMVLGLVVFTELASGSPSGAPAAACTTMTPSPNTGGSGHGVAPQSAETADLPFSLSSSATTYQPGGNSITLTLTWTGDGDGFKGFLVKVKTATSNDAQGTLTLTDATQGHSACADTSGNAVTHSDRDVKSSVAMEWRAPADLSGELQVIVTVVQVKTMFWAQHNLVTLTEEPTETTTGAGAGDTSTGSGGGTGDGVSMQTSVALIVSMFVTYGILILKGKIM